jgi:hypothetical protein
MADFVAVLRKTIQNLGDNTPEMREKVYDKARATIVAKLEAIDPPPPPAVVERQKKALEDAIAVVRTDYEPAAPEPIEEDELTDVMGRLERGEDMRDPEPPAPSEAERPDDGDDDAADAAPLVVGGTQGKARGSGGRSGEFDAGVGAERDDDDEIDRLNAGASTGVAPVPQRAKRSGGSRTGLIAAVVALVIAAGAGYGIWVNRDDFASLAGLGGSATDAPVEEVTAPADAPSEPAEEVAATEQPAPEPAAMEQAADEQPQPEPGAAEGEGEASTDVAAASPAEPEKFTQRLMPDGSEVDTGPSDDARSIGEGTSVASAVEPAEGAEPAEAAAAAEEAADDAPIAVGQRAIFYEERTSTAQGSAEMGSIIWSVVEESPGAELPPEPAIRAEATIPGKDLQLRMTIRRNGDETLPASHIIEMIFLTPEGFEGGGISNVTRVTFKENEQAAGNPLIGIPAKIADGFFLVALSNQPAETETNVTVMRRQSWIDIPLVYTSGRRALITLEKGVPGERAFEEAMRAWAEATSG